jgi:poly-gamma-glutamate synthesis protein (capsule biosynthesis protein)
MSAPEAVSIAALGDVILTPESDVAGRDDAGSETFAALRLLLGDALVFANLETTIVGGAARIEKQPRIIADARSVRNALAGLRVDVVSLANNHSCDACLAGLERVRMILEREDIGYFGAGRNAAEAARPWIVERNGIRLGWLGYVDRDTRPSHVATAERYGVNPLEPERALGAVECLKRKVDHVIVSLHWGIEYCHVPAPEHVRLARALVDRGASLVVGHHAHVIQGVEAYGDGVIAYGLGNASTADLHIDGRLAIKQTRRTRSSLVLRATLGKSGVCGFEVIPIRFARRRFVVKDLYAERLLARANRRLSAPPSAWRWRTRRVVEDVVLRSLWRLDPRVIRSLRPAHAVKLLRNLAGRGPAA